MTHPYPSSPLCVYIKQHTQEGVIILIDKPLHWTSFDVVNKLKKKYAIKKIGHAGTLDPLAKGLLIICTGKKTKQISQYQDLLKTYVGTMVIGKTTPSIDLETDFNSQKNYRHITTKQIHHVFKKFFGYIPQIPPQYSAVKIKGKRAYQKIRQGESVELKPKIVFIKSMTITHIHLPAIRFKVVCGKGFYIRSLVQDIGKQLGVGAYLAALQRTQIGEFTLEKAYSIKI